MITKKTVTKAEGDKATEAVKPVFSGKYFEATGRRKTANARVRLYQDKGKRIIINGRDYKSYLPTAEAIKLVELPLRTAGFLDSSVVAQVRGGGIAGQADAVSHGISRVLLKIDKDLRVSLKPLDLLTRDPRQKERKKPGLKRARRAPQWAKR